MSKIEGRFAASHTGERLDRALAELVPDLSRERIKALIAEGQVEVAGRIAKKSSETVVADTGFCVCLPPPVPSDTPAVAMPLVIVHEDEALLVLDKPAGLVVHPAAGHRDDTLVNALLHHCHGQLSGIGGVARPGIVHRIDKLTSGLLVVAKTDAAHAGLAHQFADHSIERRYRAIVHGHPIPASGTVTGAIARSPHNRKKMALVAEGRGKHAVTHYRQLERLRASSLIECRLETGRTHQVRVHMASIGHALVGDPVYGRSSKTMQPVVKRLQFVRQALHAAQLGFIHPITREKLAFSSEIPVDMQELLSYLRV